MTVERLTGPSLEAMAADPKSIDGDRVAREFEAMLLARVWKGASQPMGVSRLLDGGSAGRMYRELMIDEVVRRAALSRGLGLAEQMAVRLSVEAEPEPPAAQEGRTGD